MDIKNAVITAFKTVSEEQGIDMEINMDTPLTRDNGIDSLGFVNLIVEIEDNLDITLDNVISKIRKCLRVKDIVNVIEDYQETNL